MARKEKTPVGATFVLYTITLSFGASLLNVLCKYMCTGSHVFIFLMFLCTWEFIHWLHRGFAAINTGQNPGK